MSLRKLISVLAVNKNVSIYRSVTGLSMRERNSSLVIGTRLISQRRDASSFGVNTPKVKKETKNNDDDDDEDNTPIKFSDSGAATWNPVYSRTGGEKDDRPWYQTYVVIASTAAFLIYFCILREENDVDQKLTLQLSDHFEGAQKEQIELSKQLAMQAGKQIKS